MRAINKKAQKIMDTLVAELDINNTHRKIDNNGADSGIMAVSINYLSDTPDGALISVAHYYKQNGDLMADMVFLRARDGKYSPTSWRMDGTGVHRESVGFNVDGGIRWVNRRAQREQAIFAGTWMDNIKAQQHLGRR